ncbi:MAG: stage 0 sporulation family protein [Lachnospiraceae bacterium]|nr:stage 0 sporulation family protein [Lachnospiraceae bacterium]
MKKIIGVRFRNAGKSYYFDPNGLTLRMNDRVIVETSRGVEMGIISIPEMEVEDDKAKQPLKEIMRKATEEDIKRVEENIVKEKDAYRIGQQKIREHNLEMKLVQTEYTFDRNKLLFYFTADDRVDFRELVKDLAAVFRTRIELRQIGVRDETKILGGIGICGRELCCKTFLADFAPVSMKMAKEQSLSLNPTKISGVCGRLMCCLKNEEETYEYLNARMPGKGDEAITTNNEHGIVYDMNVLKQQVRVLFEENDEREIREYSVDDLTFIPRKKGGNNKPKQEPKEEEPKPQKVKEPKEPKESKESKEVTAEESENKNNHKEKNRKNKRGDNKNSGNNKKNHKPHQENKGEKPQSADEKVEEKRNKPHKSRNRNRNKGKNNGAQGEQANKNGKEN